MLSVRAAFVILELLVTLDLILLPSVHALDNLGRASAALVAKTWVLPVPGFW